MRKRTCVIGSRKKQALPGPRFVAARMRFGGAIKLPEEFDEYGYARGLEEKRAKFEELMADTPWEWGEGADCGE